MRELNEYSQIPGGVSHVTINCTVKKMYARRKAVKKEMTRPAAEQFTDIAYSPALVDYISTLDPYRLKYFDETD